MQKSGDHTTPCVSHLYDPKIGFIYSFDLFEKDLYRDKIFEHRREIPATFNRGEKTVSQQKVNI